MYKVFIDHKPVIFIDRDDFSTGKNSCSSKDVKEFEHLQPFMKNASIDAPLFVLCKSPQKTFKRIFEEHKKIDAAGGIVQRKEKYLVIKRKGLWDIPKGRVDKGESNESACVREIMEECGINGHEIVRPLTTTLHTMKWNGRKALKRTYWFMLSYDGPKKTTPETKEDITEAVWMKHEKFLSIRSNTFGSINDVLDAFESNNGAH